MAETCLGFITWEPHYGAAPCAPSGSFTIQTIGGKRSIERIKQEIATLEKHLGWLKSELSGHPDYARITDVRHIEE